jgi:hypothetical protein
MTGDDPLPGQRAAAMAGAAAEAVRGLNHAVGEDGIGRPSAACDILGSLSPAALAGDPGAAQQQLSHVSSSPRKDQP